VPPIVLPVLVNLVADIGYNPGDEVPIPCGSAGNNAATEQCLSVFVDGINLYVHTGFLSAGNEANVVMWSPTVANTMTNISVAARWALKVYLIQPTNGLAFTVGDIANNTGANSTAHGFTSTPNLVFPVYHYTANDANLATTAGMEQNIDCTAQNVGAKGCPSAVRVNATNVLSNTAQFVAGLEGNFVCWVVNQFNFRTPSSLNNCVLRTRVFSITPSFVQTVAVGFGQFSFAHGFTKTPQLVYPVISCIANDAASGYTAGDEIPLKQFTESKGAFGYFRPGSACLVAANATKIFGDTSALHTGGGIEGIINAWQTPASNLNPTFNGNFQLKIYAWAI
jgi:hypothetical protein